MMDRKPTTVLSRLGVPVLAALLAACSGGESTRTAMAQEIDERATAEERVRARAESPDYAAVNELSAAFRSASGRALPAVVFIGVEREAGAAAAPTPNPFERFFDFPGVPRSPEGRQLPPQLGSGSGFIVDESGLIVTNHHVVDGARRLTVRLNDGREFQGEIAGSDASTDIAVVRIDAEGEDLPAVPWGDSESLLVGDWVLALGNPLGLEFTVTSGIVSARGRQLNSGSSALESYIQTDAAINPGNSGGPLIDLAGNVVGINSAIYGGQRFVGYGFAVPSRLAQRVIRDLLEFGHVRRPRLGIRVSDVTAVDAEAYGLSSVRGADVNSVEAGSPAADAGLRVGDVVLELDGMPIENSNVLITTLAQRNPGDEVELTVWRDGEDIDVEVELGEFARPEDVGRRASSEPSVDDVTGLEVRALTAEIRSRLQYEVDEGVLVTGVQPYGPAARAGVRAGQTVIAIGGERVESVADYNRIAGAIESGDVVSLRVIDPDLGETIINFRTVE